MALHLLRVLGCRLRPLALWFFVVAGTACSQPLEAALIISQPADDGAYNELAWQGMRRADDELLVEAAYKVAPSASDFSQAVDDFIKQGKRLIVVAAFDRAEATAAFAAATPNVDFACIDVAYDQPRANLRGAIFRTAQATRLAGYLAAGMSQTGKVGAFGGKDEAPVRDFLSGFADGVATYNQVHGTTASVLGSDRFIDSWDDEEAAAQIALELMSAGADILMPVAGGAGRGALRVAAAEEGVLFIGVDTDWYSTQPSYGAIILTSVVKQVDQAVFETVQMAYRGQYSAGNYEGTLANGGVALAPFHELDGRVPSELKQELTDLSGSSAVDH